MTNVLPHCLRFSVMTPSGFFKLFRSVNLPQRNDWFACWHIDEAKLQPNYVEEQRSPSWGGGAIGIIHYAEELIFFA